MSLHDPISDLVTRIRNGYAARKQAIEAPASKLVSGVLDTLTREGYIRGFEISQVRKGVSSTRIELKYFEGKPVVDKLKRVSRPGCRSYSSIGDLKASHNGLGTFVLSTSRGILSDREARAQNVGGEVLFEVF